MEADQGDSEKWMSLRYILKPTDFIPEALSLREVEFWFLHTTWPSASTLSRSGAW